MLSSYHPLPTVSQPQEAMSGNGQFLTFSNPYITNKNDNTGNSAAPEDQADDALIGRLVQLLKSGCMAISRVEIESLIGRACRSSDYENAEMALAELCLEINMLSAASSDIGKRITVWFDSYSQRLNLKTEKGQSDCISLAAVLKQNPA